MREIIVEVQGHLATTNEDPVATFGQAVDYAAQWARLSPRHWISQVLLGAIEVDPKRWTSRSSGLAWQERMPSWVPRGRVTPRSTGRRPLIW